MVETKWTRQQAAEAAACVSRLEALHRELAGVLVDDHKRDELWAQIEDEHHRFAALLSADES